MKSRIEVRVGNLARHKSGGPIMLIDCVHQSVGGNWVGCVWVENGERRSSQFKFDDLDLVSADGSPRNYATES